MSYDISGTTDISWIRLAIIARYPNIIKDKGADLDNNGKIEGNEAFGGLDSNSVVDDKDFWLYLEKNRTLIANQIEFFKYQGNNISDDNIINHLMFVESRICKKGDVKEAYTIINSIIAKTQKDLSNTKVPKDLLEFAYKSLKDDFSFTIKGLMSNPLLIDNIMRAKLDCDTSTYLLLAIAHECKWPLFAVCTDAHVFLRWDDKQTTFNFDEGSFYLDQAYMKMRVVGEDSTRIDESSIRSGVYLKSLSRNETIGLFYCTRGIANNALGNNKDAIEDYNKAIKLGPKNVSAFIDRGIAKNALGNNKAAIEDYNEAIKLDPRNEIAYNNRGVAKNDLGDHTGAIKDYAQAIQLVHKYTDVFFNRGVAKDALGDHSGAMEDYTQVIKLDPKDAKAYFRRGAAKDALGNLMGASEDYTEAIKLVPNFSLAYCNRGTVRYAIGDHKGAIEDYTEAIMHDPKLVTAHFNRGAVRDALGNNAGALEDYTQAIKLDPNLAPAYFNRGIVRNAMGDHKGANEDFNEAIRLNPQLKEMLRKMGH